MKSIKVLQQDKDEITFEHHQKIQKLNQRIRDLNEVSFSEETWWRL